MASSSPSLNLNLHFSPEWMRTGSSAASNTKLPSSGSTNHAPLLSASMANGTLPSNTLNGTSPVVSSNASNGSVTADGLPAASSHQQAGLSGGLLTPAPTGQGTSSPLNPQPLSAYSSLLTPASTIQSSRLSPNTTKDPTSDMHDPFRYSREDILSIWRVGAVSNGGPGWSLGIEVEQHDGVVIDLERVPSCAREMTEAELKLYSAPSLNSRRPSISHAHSTRGERDGESIGLGILGRRGTGDASITLPSRDMRGGGPASPLRERFPRRDSTGITQPYRPRQLSASGTTPGVDAPLISPRTNSGGFGFGGGPGFDGVLGAGEGWGGRKRGALANAGRGTSYLKEIQEKAGKDDSKPDQAGHSTQQAAVDVNGREDGGDEQPTLTEEPAFENWEDDPETAGQDEIKDNGTIPAADDITAQAKEPPPNPADITWEYLDDQQITQGPFTPDQLKVWDASNWLRPDLKLNRPAYDKIMIPLSEWKSKLHDMGITDDTLVFHTWFEPVEEEKPVPATIDPPPGLAKPSPPQQLQETEKQIESEPETSATNETPSVFDALINKADVGANMTPSSLHGIGIRGTHTPSSIFGGSTGDGVFSHSPVGAHRLPMRTGVLETGSNSPASIHAGGNGNGLEGFSHSGLTGSRLGALHAQLANVGGAPSPFAAGLNYSPHASLRQSQVSSPMVGFAGSFGNPASVEGQGVYSQTGSLYGSSLRQGSFDQQSAISAPWQASRSNLAPSAGIPARTNSSASTTSNNHRVAYGVRSSSPANIIGSLTGALGGEIYEGTVGSLNNNAIGRDTGIPVNQSPQQLYGTLYKTPVHTIPEASPAPPSEPIAPLSESLKEVVPIGEAVIQGQEGQKPGYASIVQKLAGAENLDANIKLATKEASINPWTANIQPATTTSKSAWNIPLQTTEASQPIDSVKEIVNIAPATQQPAKGKSARKRDPSADVATAKAVPLPVPTPISPQDDSGDGEFVPVKKRTPNHAASAQQSSGSSAAVTSPTVSTISSITGPSKMTVPLAALITNAPSTASQSPVTPAAGPPKAWASVGVKDEAKSLKEIQEAEERRARENQRARPAALVTSPSSGGKDEELTTLSWGLPTSLAGSRVSATKETSSSTSSTPGAVWANAAKSATAGTKKAMTMKDIQEEEERRKQKEKDVVTAAKRVAEKKPAPTPAPVAASGGAWSTIGPSGKTSRPSTGSPALAGIASLPPRPSAAAIASSGMRAPHVTTATSTLTATPAGAPSTRRPPATQATNSASAKPANGEEAMYGVSTETLKWMRDTFKGKLSKGITVDEVVGLVLMMQEEDDIADTIYQSSPTLPGKRFAAEFIERRTADRANGSSVSAPRRAVATTSVNAGTDSTVLASAALQDSFQVVKKKKGGKV